MSGEFWHPTKLVWWSSIRRLNAAAWVKLPLLFSLLLLGAFLNCILVRDTANSHSILRWQVALSAAQWLTGTMTIWSSCWPWGTLGWERPPSSTGILTTSSTASSQVQWVLTSEKREWWVMLGAICLGGGYAAQRSGGHYFVFWFRHTQGRVLMGWPRGTSKSIFSCGTQQDKRGESNLMLTIYLTQVWVNISGFCNSR